MVSVELGFAKETAPWKLRSKFFPSKLGGKPAWLTLKDLPEPSDLLCKNCKNPFIFLLQVYSNIDECSDTFHRSIFVFMCSNGKCNKRFSNQNFIVFRTQLPRKNDFYSFEPPTMNKKVSNSSSAEQYQRLCDACGCKAITVGDKFSKMNYCNDYHKGDWNQIHKETCGKEAGTKKKNIQSNPFLLPEYKIISFTEVIPSAKPEKSEAEKMQEYQDFICSAQVSQDFQNAQSEDLDIVIHKKDKAYNKFRKVIEHEREQILRYQRGGNPLLVSSEYIPTEADIPPCSCGAKRTFEFQIMPQILIKLSLDSLSESPDWGTLLVYTCCKSCEAGTGAYVQEFLWKQDYSNTQ